MIYRHEASDSEHPILPTESDTRALTVVVSDAEWQALRRLEPDPVSWLRNKVRERLDPATATNFADIAESTT